MIASRVTLPVEEERAEADGAKGVGGVADLDHLERSCALLRLMVATSMAHNMEVVGNRKGNKKMA